MYQPIVLNSGVAGWQFLQRTYDRQLEIFTQSPELNREISHFRENILTVRSADDLVNDRMMLKVVLGAFGLEEDIENRYLIKKMLEEGTTSDDALANKFADERYRDMSEAFGLGPGEIPKYLFPGFSANIIQKYEAASFEVATGEQDETMRIALYAQRTLGDVLSEPEATLDQKWFSIMGQPPLRAVFETALNLPSQFSQIDIDQQLSVFKEKASRVFGSSDPAIFLDDEAKNDLLTTYVARAQVLNGLGSASSASIALTLLQS
jgi:hypothetical protein